jgi:hypothetical protein
MNKQSMLPVFLCVLFLCAAGCKREAELYYDASEYAVDITGYGYSAEQDVECCVVFAADTLYDYIGWRIVAIRLFNSDQNTPVSYTPEVYEARAGIGNPDGLVSRNASPSAITSLNWLTIELETPVTIASAMDYWAGYAVAALPGQTPLAAGGEPDYANSYLSTGGGFALVTRNWVVRIVVRK